jgi:hypothetical protein
MLNQYGPISHYGCLLCGPRSTWDDGVLCDRPQECAQKCLVMHELALAALADEVAERASMWEMP